jgi:23S rRNA pseudouridine2605 synthase
MSERVHKLIAQSGVMSRRQAEVMIAEGKVKLNGQTITEMGTKATFEDVIEVNGQIIDKKEEPVTYVFYKPERVVTTTHDPEGRPTVIDYISDARRIYPVGRLDYDTSGLLLLTNEGDLANLLTQPKHHIPKIYEVTFSGVLRRRTSNIFEKGMILEKRKLQPVEVHDVKVDPKTEKTTCRLILREGKNHQIKKMLSEFGHEVIRLKRLQIGPLTLEGLQKGTYRVLKPHEKKQLTAAVKIKKSPHRS